VYGEKNEELGRMRTNNLNERQAIFLAAVCSQSYAQYSHADGRFVVPEGYEIASTFNAKSITGQTERFGFILQSADRIIVAFRGTSSTTDWISDAIARQSKFKCDPGAGMTHQGISNIYFSARGPILECLNRLPSDLPLTITGHSLGGALATLCAVDVTANTSFKFPVVYTYGAPRVGDPTFAKSYSDQVTDSYRVQNKFDVVPRLPPQVYKLPKRETTYYYMHVQEEAPLTFHNGSVSANHVISSYYTALAKLDPAYAKMLRDRNPGFCPVPELYPV
jgi:triacylglycerol lipase